MLCFVKLGKNDLLGPSLDGCLLQLELALNMRSDLSKRWNSSGAL